MKSLVAALIISTCGSAAAEDFNIGPWRLGMSTDQVQSFSEYGPYVPVGVTGGLETFNGTFEGRSRNVSFVFDTDSTLAYIQVWNYEGSDRDTAKDRVLEIFDLFAANFGGVEIEGVDVQSAGGLTREAAQAAITTLLGPAKEMGEKLRREENAAMLLLLDMKPREQPDNSRLHSQWGYSSRFDTFYVFLFQDRPDAPARRVESNVQLESLEE